MKLIFGIFVVFACLSSSAATTKQWHLLSKLLFDGAERQEDIGIFNFSDDGRLLLVTNFLKTHLTVFDSKNGKLLYNLKNNKAIASYKFSPDGTKIVLRFSYYNQALVIDANSGEKLYSIENKSPANHINIIIISPDGSFLATGNNDGTIKFYNLTSGNEIEAFNDHTDRVNSISYSSSGKKLVTASNDGFVNTYETDSGKLISSLKIHSKGVKHAEFTPDETKIYADPTYANLRVIDVRSSDIKEDFYSLFNRCGTPTILDDMRAICFGIHPDYVTYFDINGSVLYHDTAKAPSYDPHFPMAIYILNKDKKILAIGDEKFTRIYRLGEYTANTISFIETNNRFGMKLSSDGGELFTLHKRQIDIFTTSSPGNLAQTLSGHSLYVEALAVSPDGLRFASVDSNNEIIVWQKK
jgi:WD40 repeat protein